MDHIINLSELLRTKPKSLELMNKKILKMENLHFLSNNILTRIFKELITKRLSIIFKLYM